ncbi:hemicentin-2 [Nephila pilipes]|uniref:Hemicentin-2 n=1 Tax=Nephila pilipes TaxID=299642 RepID=A0A8X6QVL4_NEPPI|nr:hemicentin-2 [Nephila pilipes]
MKDRESKNIDECSFGNFGCSHRCVNTEGGAHCSCYKGYRLHNNRKQCEDINECFSRNFDCSHECVNTLGGAYCACRKGYKLHKDLKQCVDVDECSDDKLNRCDHDCLNFEGGYNCSCRPGYVSLGDFRCEPCRTNSYKSVNNLACVDCPAHSYTNGGGKTSIEDCFCNSGFSGNLADNVPCQDINECATENFGCSDICSNTLGSAHCACPPGFELQEDHKTCKEQVANISFGIQFRNSSPFFLSLAIS